MILAIESFSIRFLDPSDTFFGGDGFLEGSMLAPPADEAWSRRRLGELDAEETLFKLGLRE